MPIVAWQHWRLELPARWSPVKLEGDAAQGVALFADLHRPRLGMRWMTKPKKKKLTSSDWLAGIMRQEVGALAADEAKPASNPAWANTLLYVEPEPPGRDVWIGYSPASNRALLLAYHARRRERILTESILPTATDLPGDEPTPWSIFELSCIVPPRMKLAAQRLNAGDLSLSFAATGKAARQEPRQVTVRQIAVAQLALQRMSLEKWLDQQQRLDRQHYRPTAQPREVKLEAAGRPLEGWERGSKRRLRFLWKCGLSPRRITYALHDARRDRLVFVEASREDLARDVIATVGWARQDESLETGD